jgi:hypothetical protein
MDRKKLFKHIAYFIFFIFLMNLFADKFYWYFSIWYFDMLMHLLGGFWLGLIVIWFFNFQDISGRLILQIILSVLFLGAGWEFFEFIFNNFIAQNSFNSLDTISDIFFDLSGGALAILYFLQRIMFTRRDAVQ